MPLGTRGSDPATDLKFSHESGFFDRSPVLRVLIAGLFGLCLFGLLHFREVRVDILELDTLANRYVVAQTDFSFFDREATLIRKQEAVRDIGQIYRFNEQQIRERKKMFDDLLTRDQSWREVAAPAGFDEMLEAMREMEEALLGVRFTDARTLSKMHQVGLSTAMYQLFFTGGPSEEVLFPSQTWKQIQEAAYADVEILPIAGEFVVKFLSGLTWTTEEDVTSQQRLRELVQKQVPDKVTTVKAGTRLIDQGERVTSRHLAMMKAMKRALTEQRNLFNVGPLTGSLCLTLLLLGICYLFLHHYYRQILNSNRRLVLLISVALLTLGVAKGAEWALLQTPTRFAEYLGIPIVVPFTSILLCSLLSPGIALVGSGFVTMVLTMSLTIDRQAFLLLNLVAAVVTILSTNQLRYRKEVFAACVKAWVACAAVALSLRLYQSTFTGITVAGDLISTAFFMGLVGIVVVGVLPMFESIFKVITDMTLIEFMDPNHELLRRLSIEAPGTYQHSVVVGNLAETAAIAIGANGLFCRVSTLYHDIGKLTAPHYFTENQQGGMNMHQLLTPLESAQVIIAHVSEGVAMARRAGLPEQFIDVIKEHHGTTLVYFFYHKEVERLGGDRDRVDEKEFRYAGPKPRTKESAIIMIADTLEAASRSLDEITEEGVRSLLDRLVRGKAEDGQFDECQLTFEELGMVKNAMVKTLLAAGHSRIKYPKPLPTSKGEEEAS